VRESERVSESESERVGESESERNLDQHLPHSNP